MVQEIHKEYHLCGYLLLGKRGRCKFEMQFELCSLILFQIIISV